MQALEVTGTVNVQGELSLDRPLETFTDSRVRFIVLVPEQAAVPIEAEAEWTRLTTEQFLHGYSEADALYEKV